MKKYIFVICLVLISEFSSGCQTYTRYQVSAPNNKGLIGRGREKRLVFPDMEIASYPGNSAQTLDIFAVTIIPVYVNTKKGELKNKPFEITLQFFPKEKGFTLIPGEVFLKIEGSEAIQPYQYYGPKPYSQEAANFYRGKPYSIWWTGLPYGDLEYDKKIENSNCHTEVALPDLQLWNRFDLFFDTVPPEPSKKFTLIIQGLRKNGKPYQVLKLEFAQTTYEISDSAP